MIRRGKRHFGSLGGRNSLRSNPLIFAMEHYEYKRYINDQESLIKYMLLKYFIESRYIFLQKLLYTAPETGWSDRVDAA